MRFNTDLLHAGVVREANGATLPPVYQSSAFEQDTAADLEKIFENKAPDYCYTRVGNPTVTAFENRIAKLEGGMASIACASGMAAIMNAILNIVRSGDEIVSSASLYGGSIDLFRDIEEFGIKTRYVKNNDWEAIEGAINEHTRLLFAETIGNPCLDVTDVERLAEIAHAHKIPLILDNTTATAYLFQGLNHGADIVINSSSKYINGSSNSISGILTYSGRFQWDPEMYPQIAAYKKFGPMAYIARLRNSLFRDTGACLAPMNAYLNLIGMETLGLRMERQCSNALELAQWLEETYPSVTVNYPGLKSSNWYEIAEKHSVQTTAYYGIKKLQCAIPSEILSKWEEAHLRGLSVSIRFKAELNNVCDVFTKEKLVHIPLKGSIIKDMYPSTDMRSMSDMDILIKREDEKKVHDILIGMGYTCDMYDISHQDVYFKEPIYNIEIHTSLFDDGDGVTFYREYDNILDRTVTVDNEYARLMTDEDFYVYNIAHFAKHFQLGGSGIRSVMDMYIMKKSLTGMDMSYVNAEFAKLGLSDFYTNASKLVDYWFGDGELTADVKDMADYILSSGTYGNLYNAYTNQLEKKGRFRMFMYNAFPPLNKMLYTFPFLKKVPWLLPFCWIARWFYAIFTKPKNVVTKVKMFARVRIKSGNPR